MNKKRGLALVFACAIGSAVVFAATYPRFFASPPAVRADGAPGPASAPAAPLAIEFAPLIVDRNPLSWANLTPQQHAALAPFAAEWARFSDERKRKWIKIASRFAKMSPEAQKRLHERMAEWVRMTPEQHRVARENYQIFSKALPPQARQKAWKAYQELSPEQKAHLAALERKRRPTIVSAPPSGAKSAIRGINRLVDTPPAGASGVTAASAAGHASGGAPAQPGAASAVPAAPTPLSPSEAPDMFKGA